MFILIILLLLALSPAAIQSNPSRLLDSHTDSSGLCHDVILNSSSIYLEDKYENAEQLASTYGLVFMLENTANDLGDGSATVEVTGLSIYLDGTTGANYSVYVIDEEYVTVDEETGTKFSMLGGVLGEGIEVGESGEDSVGWKRHGDGWIDENNMDYEGMSVMILDVPITMEAGDLKSIYIKLSTVDLCVMETYDDGGQLVAESVDQTVQSEEGFGLLEIRVGRAVSYRLLTIIDL
jgi:hypothetical protein